MKRVLNKIFAIIMFSSVIIQLFSPLMVYAETISYDGESITILGGTFEDNVFKYDNGNLRVTVNGESIDENDITTDEGNSIFMVNQNDTIVVSFEDVTENYGVRLVDEEGNNYELEDNLTYTFEIGSVTDSTIFLEPIFIEKGMIFDFWLNGKEFTEVRNGDTLTVEDFNFDSINELYFTRIETVNDTDSEVNEYLENEYSYNMLNDEGKHILEANISKTSDNFGKIRIEAHAGDIQEGDYAPGKGQDDYKAFYITEIYIQTTDFVGVGVNTNVMPDSYDFTTWNGVDLSVTTIDNPGVATAYYDEDTINLSNDDIEEISLVPGKGVPASAISIDNDAHTVTVLSNYYNIIPLKIKLNDGTVGYVNINRIGIFIGSVNQGNTSFPHGASAFVGENINVDTDKDRIVAVFYHENTKQGSNYNLIVNLTYSDGSEETTIATYVGDVNNSSGNIIGSDYILWKGTENSPVKVSVIAVDANALTNSNTFGGATFGSGEGVTWERN